MTVQFANELKKEGFTFIPIEPGAMSQGSLSRVNGKLHRNPEHATVSCLRSPINLTALIMRIELKWPSMQDTTAYQGVCCSRSI